MRTGRFDESIVQYGKALTIDPHFGGSYVGIAGNHMLAGRHDAAIAELDDYYRSARDDSERRTALLNQAMVNVDRGATDKAIAAMNRASAIASAAGDTINMAADEEVAGDILLEAGRVSDARARYARAHALVAASSANADVKADDVLAAHYDAARVSLASHDAATAKAEAAAYAAGAAARKNDVRVRQSHLLNAELALHDGYASTALTELALADQENPVVWWELGRASAARGDTAKARASYTAARDMNILPSFDYVFARRHSVGDMAKR